MEKRTRKRSKEASRARLCFVLGLVCIIAGFGALFLGYTWVASSLEIIGALLVGITIGIKLPRTREN
ncbi:hypothetical protein PWEIH_10833 [Listeria weihenstephanensis FSL R9-0317]|uniref:Uncharacterized protein n=1 Tax=Listeria weihenstephanensis TaxID=1006155 RepID=A0A1S7FVB5_9LIST|nr:hypothetical protein [Listeria weihenstephanensis]AQY51378.1 hypothetical protein UE46_10120 [Listeria weihenstephanensis]EUJ37180.1 hypothetical protein PWEIH_10833 [Listeria weihenstephanensis FSL R9-0317]